MAVIKKYFLIKTTIYGFDPQTEQIMAFLNTMANSGKDLPTAIAIYHCILSKNLARIPKEIFGFLEGIISITD